MCESGLRPPLTWGSYDRSVRRGARDRCGCRGGWANSAHTLPAVGSLSTDLGPSGRHLSDGGTGCCSYEFDGRRHQLPLSRNAATQSTASFDGSAGPPPPAKGTGTNALSTTGLRFRTQAWISIEYTLLDNGLQVGTTVTNVGAEACPYGSGARPYLTLGAAIVDRLIANTRANRAEVPHARSSDCHAS